MRDQRFGRRFCAVKEKQLDILVPVERHEAITARAVCIVTVDYVKGKSKRGIRPSSSTAKV